MPSTKFVRLFYEDDSNSHVMLGKKDVLSICNENKEKDNEEENLMILATSTPNS